MNKSQIEIYIFRHGETEYNREGRVQGSIDIPLNENGENQALDLARKLSKTGISQIFSSPSGRAKRTAEIVATMSHASIDVVKALKEIDFGLAQGKTKEELLIAYGEPFMINWRKIDADAMHLGFPAGETKKQCQDRAVEAVTSIALTCQSKVIGISTHGSFLRLFIHSIIGHEGELIPTPNCVLYKVTFDRSTQKFSFEGRV
ncbi:MAG: histidine phosphatase family protein [Proteobacteria bacterium]|nr:histidine phosphatase family protein [Pseudomonadota bacterium]